MSEPFLMTTSSTRHWMYEHRVTICISAFLFIHLILMMVLVCTLATVAPEIKTTLDDVRVMVPQMHRALVDLGSMVPEIRVGMNILNQVCDTIPTCEK